MNQILEFGTDNNNKNKAPKGGRGSGSISSDKIIKFFAIFLMILAIALIGSGAYSLLKNKKDSNPSTSSANPVVKASITAEKDEENGIVIISVASQTPIDKLIYNWDQEAESLIDGKNLTNIEEKIDLSEGIHTLNVKVIDTNKNQTIEQFEFESETGVDTVAPEIMLEITENKTLLITATDNTQLEYITYMWNEGEQVTVQSDEENKKQIQIELDIPIGKNTITVIAVDSSNKTKSASKTLEGVTKPVINYGWPNGDASTLEIITTHENGIKSIYYTLNGNPAQYETPEGETQTSLSFTINSFEGYNELELTITSVDDTVTEFNRNWEYYPNVAPTTEDSEVQDTSNNVSE